MSKRRYASEQEAIQVRIEACRLAAVLLASEDGEYGKERLWATCVFFESYIGHGATRTAKWMDIDEPKRLKAPVVQLITRD